jgi:alpha-mannosidase
MTRGLSAIAMTAFALATWAASSLGAESPTNTTGGRFTRLRTLPAPQIVKSSTPYPGGRYTADKVLDADPRTEYSSDSKGLNTYIEFQFDQPTAIAAFRHVDRNDPATVAASELILKDAAGAELARVPVTHVGKPGSVTSFVLPTPVTARRVRWQVTGLGARKLSTVGAAEIGFFTTAGAEDSPKDIAIEASIFPVVEKKAGKRVQPMRVVIDYPYAQPIDATLAAEGIAPVPLHLAFGQQTLDLSIPAAESKRSVQLSITTAGQVLAERELKVAAVRQATIYILPHSHVDIGYTAVQTEIERKQMANIAKGIELAQATAGNPEGSRYKWNVEVLWAVESYLRQSSVEQQNAFIEAVKKGSVGLDAMYANELTGLCRPEELLRLFRYATELGQRCGVKIESAMISDVPGYTWGVVPAMAQAGVKYWSIGPNYFDRMGYTIANWENKPFYWAGPSGRDKVLCWIPYQGYAISHILRSNMTEKFVFDLMSHLQKIGYPYDISHLRWSGHGDNAPPDEKLPDFVRTWNEKYASPRLVIATTTEAFREFERRYGDRLPTYSADWTPYWEDGAGSSARETGINRASAERLTQAEAAWAILDPAHYPAAEFDSAWRNVLLYSEHTWGAHNSITEPESQFVADQWKIKQAFALDAETQSKALLEKALSERSNASTAGGVTVLNTNGWLRTDLATVPKTLSAAGDRVTDSAGKAVPSQRLSSGELAFLASDVPPLGARHYTISAGPAASDAELTVREDSLANGLITVRVDAKTGAISELRAKGIEANLADANSIALNDYFFVAGSDTEHPLRSGPVKITVKERGPLVASLLIESDAPGCKKLTREVRLVAGLDRVEIINIVDKNRAEVRGKAGDRQHARNEGKEGVHFGFAFNVPDGVMRMDLPWAVARPEADQLPGACKNWFTVQRWVDVSNDQYGVTWSPLDAPLVEVGAITANLLGSQTNPKAWMDRVAQSAMLYSWVMNNHWHTNYRAYQEGPTTFRYALQPHSSFHAESAARFGAGISQPLLVTTAAAVPTQPGLQVAPPEVLLTGLKPADDGQGGFIIRLFGASGKPASATLNWADSSPRQLWFSDTSERPRAPVTGPIDVPAWGIVTLRASGAKPAH